MAQAQQSQSAQITAQQLETWDRFASVYADLAIGKQNCDAASQQVIAAVDKHKRAAEDSQFLDIASSAGQPAVPLAQAFPRVQIVSTDLSLNSVKLAAASAKQLGLANFRAEVADAQDLSAFGVNSFAVVTCTYGMMFIPEFRRALREVYRVLQPGGLFAITLFAEEARSQNVQMFLGLTKALMQDYPDWPLPAPSCSVEDAAWQQLLEEANFGQVSLSEYAQVVLFEMPELMEFMLGPCSQFAPLLDKLQAAGKANIHQEAPQMLQDLCRRHKWVHDDHVSLENTALLVTGVKPYAPLPS